MIPQWSTVHDDGRRLRTPVSTLPSTCDQINNQGTRLGLIWRERNATAFSFNVASLRYVIYVLNFSRPVPYVLESPS
jgi:hypothetical protein